METLTEAPKITSFVPLVEHQSTTPASFYTGPPVLHYYSDRSTLVIDESELTNAPALENLVSKASSSTPNGTSHSNGDESTSNKQQILQDVDIWVTSDKVFLYSQSLQTGLSIPYPSISLHAIQSLPVPSETESLSQGLYMQIMSDPSAPIDEDVESDSVSITLIPTASAPPVPASAAAELDADAPLDTEDQAELTPVQALFTALSNCSNLHPDPTYEDEEEEMDGIEGSSLYQAGLAMPGAQGGGLPPPMPGSGGWITAENMHDYFDAEGNWIGPSEEDAEMEVAEEELGPGAGTVRTREEGENGNGAGEDETKWRRTE